MTRFCISSFALAVVAIAMLAGVQPATARTDSQAHASAKTFAVSGKEFSFKLSAKSIAKPGTVYAFDTTTGKTLWTTKAPAGINSFPAIDGDTLLVTAATTGFDKNPHFQLIAYSLTN